MAVWSYRRKPENYAIQNIVPTQDDLAWARKQSTIRGEIFKAARKAIEQNNLWRLAWCLNVPQHSDDYDDFGLNTAGKNALFETALSLGRIEAMSLIPITREAAYEPACKYSAKHLEILIRHSALDPEDLPFLTDPNSEKKHSLLQEVARAGELDKVRLLVPLARDFAQLRGVHAHIAALNYTDSHTAILGILEKRLQELNPALVRRIATPDGSENLQLPPSSGSTKESGWERLGDMVVKKKWSETLNGEVLTIVDFAAGRLRAAFINAQGKMTPLDAQDLADVQGPVVQEAEEAFRRLGGRLPTERALIKDR